MSQNKTVIQGLEAADTKPGGLGSGNNFYTRGQNAPAKGTVVPGMMNAAQYDSGNSSNQYNNGQQVKTPKQTITGKPVVGFLYSVSRTSLGEFWPLHLGRNTIGQNKESDIVLSEGTVSLNHAVIITRQGKNGIIAAIKDTESTNGTFINDEPIDFSAEECHNGDIITIGNHYKFVFILVDAAKLGLAPDGEFIVVESGDEDNQDDINNGPIFMGGGTKPGGFDPFSDGPTTWGNKTGGYNSGNETVGMDGMPGAGVHGGTVPM